MCGFLENHLSFHIYSWRRKDFLEMDCWMTSPLRNKSIYGSIGILVWTIIFAKISSGSHIYHQDFLPRYLQWSVTYLVCSAPKSRRVSQNCSSLSFTVTGRALSQHQVCQNSPNVKHSPIPVFLLSHSRKIPRTTESAKKTADRMDLCWIWYVRHKSPWP